jgi:preprotein translocase subunit SecY
MFTALLLVIYRLGSYIPVPGVNVAMLENWFAHNESNLFGMWNLFAGGNLGRASIFALGIMPYITSSIVLQLLGSILPFFEKLKKEGAEGQKKMNQYSRYGTVIIAAFNSVTVGIWLWSMREQGVIYLGNEFSFMFLTIVTLVTGTMMVMWLGEQITEHGIGNGISLIIFAGIIVRYPEGFVHMFRLIRIDQLSIFKAVLNIAVMVLSTTAVILVTEAMRKIPIQYAKRIVGRKVYGGQSTHIPLRVNTAGVIPIIFAQSIILFPQTIFSFFKDSDTMATLVKWLSPGHFLYTVLYMGLIVFFAYFYTAIVLNPVEMAENMKRYGGFIPGRKPGKKTAEYINNVLTRITLPGGIFFAIIALMPEMMREWLGLPFYFGGTGLIIVVGVALDTLQQIESHLVMRHYEGFMKKGKLRGRRNY